MRRNRRSARGDAGRLRPGRRGPALLVIDLRNHTVGEDAAFAGSARRSLVSMAQVRACRVSPTGVMVTDAAATISEEFQRAALDYALTTVATRATAEDVIAALA